MGKGKDHLRCRFQMNAYSQLICTFIRITGHSCNVHTKIGVYVLYRLTPGTGILARKVKRKGKGEREKKKGE
jgi:hypothetical protein